jgi:Rrf2 family protein
MNISSKGRYALQALFDLASHSTDEPVKIASIAKRQKIPRKFLESSLSSLKQGGSGGYNLARLPETITVGQVLRFVDGSPRKQKGHQRETPFSELWRNVDKSVAGIVDGVNFAAIVRNWAEKQRTYVQDWDI